MILNYIWLAFFIIGFIVAVIRTIIQIYEPNTGDLILSNLFQEHLLVACKNGFEISIYLTGMLAFWMGVMRIGELSGIISRLSRFVSPFFTGIFPELPKGHPVHGQIMMNFTANMIGLDNAATPIGLKAMASMQELNPDKETASNAQIMFLVLHTSGLTLLPVNILMYRMQAGSASPADVFVPMVVATLVATFASLVIVSIWQKINLLKPRIFFPLATFAGLVSLGVYGILQLGKDLVGPASALIAGFVIFFVIVIFLILGARKKMNVYEEFVTGAKDGFGVAISIIPYLVTMLAAIAVFRGSGAMGFLESGLMSLFSLTGMNTDFVPALPTALMKPLSGGGARGLMFDTMNHYGPDSFQGRLVSIFQGSADTTFYIIAVYFGSVGIKRTRYALVAGLLADLCGVIAAIWMAYLFF